MNHCIELSAASLIVFFGLAMPTAASDFQVNLPSDITGMLYKSGGEGVGHPGCLPDDYNCAFGLELALTLDVNSEDRATAIVSKLKLYGNEAAFAGHPEDLAFIEESAANLFNTTIFDVVSGPALDRTVMTAEFPGKDLKLEFFRQDLVRMSGGPDLTAVDGPGYIFTYPVPEPSGIVLVGVGLVNLWAARRLRK